MNNINSFSEKINKESKKEFDKLLILIESDKEIKTVFNYFLYNDLIANAEKLENSNNLNNINNYTEYIDDYLQDIFIKITNNDLSIEFKKRIMEKKKEVQNKINECNNDMNILKNQFIELQFEKYLPFNSKTKLLFEKKTVLVIDKIHNYKIILGEFLTRFIFNSVNLDKNNINNFSVTNFNNFYDENNINTYVTKVNNNNSIKINDFKDISNNFKYWVLLLYILNQLFNPKSNYELILNDKNLKEYLNILVRIPKENKKKDKKKDNKKGKKKQKGGLDEKEKKVLNMFKKKSENIKDQKDKKNNKKKNDDTKEVNQYINFFNECFIKKENKTLKNIFITSFDINMKEYFISKIKEKFTDESEKPVSSIVFENPFFKKKSIKLTDIFEIKQEKIDKTYIDVLINNKMKFNIFQSINLLIENEVERNDFISKIKYKLVLLLYSLYNIKKTLYESFIKSVDSIFSLNNTVNTKVNTQKENITSNANTKKENTIRPNNQRTNNLIIKKNINNENSKVINIDVQIRNIENKILKTKNENGILEQDQKIFEYEEEIKKLIIEKYEKKNY